MAPRPARLRRLLPEPWFHRQVVIVAALVFLITVPRVTPAGIGFLGLASNLPVLTAISIATVLVGFAIAVMRCARPVVLGLYVCVASMMVHGVGVLAYDFPRGPWAWKHAGMAEYIIRHQAVDPGGDFGAMTIYHSWPGFFGLNATISETAGLSSPLPYIDAAPVVFNLIFIALLVSAFRGLTSDERIVWTGAMIFTIANWVGQSYFSPQATAYVLMLLAVTVVLRRFNVIGRRIDLADKTQTAPAAALLIVLLAAIVVTHQLTPVMAIAILAGLALLRVTKLQWPSVVLAILLLGWMASFALPYTREALFDRVLGDLMNIGERFDRALVDYAVVDPGQRATSMVARVLTVAVTGIAGLGYLRGFKSLVTVRSAAVVAAAPLLLLVLSAYANEIAFRTYFFALPGLAFLAASLWFSREPRVPGRPTIVTLSLFLVLTAACSIIANYANDVRTTFTAGEVATATYLYETAPPNSLVIQVDLLSPTKFLNFENLAELPLDSLGDGATERVLSDPAGRLAAWGRAGGHSAVYVFLTRGQAASIARMGTMPAGSLEQIDSDLRSSSQWEVISQNEHATLFRLREQVRA